MSRVPGDELGRLFGKLRDVGLGITASLLKKVFGDRTPEEHAAWDKATREGVQDQIVEPLGQGIHTPPKEGVELAPSDLRALDDLPPIDCGPIPGAEESEELKALETAGAIERDGSQVVVPDPPRLMAGLTSLMADRHTWEAFGRQLRTPDVYQAIVAPIRASLARVTSYDTLLWLSCHAAQLYGVRIRKVKAQDIYRGANAFVAQAGSGTALTNSTSSGVIDPLERSGTEEVLKVLDVPPDSAVAERVGKKDAWRIHNFREGLLNSQLAARRPYFFDRGVTARALSATLSALPQEKRDLYKAMAAGHLVEALDCPRFELYEVTSFTPWMWRYTRSAPGHVLISFRHPATHAIAEGIELKFTDPTKLHNWYQVIFTGTAAGLAGVPPLALAVIAAGLLEQSTFLGVDSHVLRPKAEQDMVQHAKRVQLERGTNAERLKSARTYIDSLVEKRDA